MNLPIEFRLLGYESQQNDLIETLRKQGASSRIWNKEAAFWSRDPAVQQTILDRLGWLDIGAVMESRVHELVEMAHSIAAAGFTHVVLLGMGGSSLCPEVLATTYGSAPGFPELSVLDTTDPAAILNTEKRIDLAHSMFVVASKSGTTTESNCLYQYFAERLTKAGIASVSEHFIAITDPGTPLEKLANEAGFQTVLSAPPDVGGRFSALTYFGMAPGALIGARIGVLLERAGAMSELCSMSREGVDNAGLALGAAITACAQQGRDKLTFITSPELSSFGWWVEQLVAESTGKENRGVLPVEGETPGDPSVYDTDRLFVYLKLEDSANKPLDDKVGKLSSAGHPVITVTLADTLDLGGQFFLWEFATAVCGACLGINPFDEPNVKESKDRTRDLLKSFIDTGKLPDDGANSVSVDNDGAIKQWLGQKKSGDYIALTAYVERTPQAQAQMHLLRTLLRDASHAATTVGFGPRFLHSTGQFHKGGPNTGLYLQITTDDPLDAAIPGEPYSFSTLKQAQALGDYQSLVAHGRRVLRIHLTGSVQDGLNALNSSIERALTA